MPISYLTILIATHATQRAVPYGSGQVPSPPSHADPVHALSVPRHSGSRPCPIPHYAVPYHAT